MVLPYQTDYAKSSSLHAISGPGNSDAISREFQPGDFSITGRTIQRRQHSCSLSNFGFFRTNTNDFPVWTFSGLLCHRWTLCRWE